MAAGNTTTGSLADSLPLIQDSARIVREYEGVCMRVCDVKKLSENTGLSWEEISLDQMTAQTVTEQTIMDNAQQFVDAMITITPTMSGLSTIVTDRVYRRITKVTIAQMGKLGQNALNRKKDEDYLTFTDSATTSLGSAGAMTSGLVSAAVSRIQSNATEGSLDDHIFTVLHGFQLKQIQDELVTGNQTYPIPHGMSEDIFRKGYSGSLFGTSVFVDGNITVDGSSDAKGVVHSKMAAILVQGKSPWTASKRREEIGGGADEIFLYDEYAFGERSAGNWMYEIYTDAPSPTS